MNVNQKELKFPSIEEYTGSRLDGTLFVYEKIDGGNCSLRKERGVVVPWSRSGRISSKQMSSFYFSDFFCYPKYVSLANPTV